ncbi:Hypothetical protein POVN_LOCUS345 [uncultured virus]|nr:Hypothetical protein POVN_LOCUS345 [uncultured virus]
MATLEMSSQEIFVELADRLKELFTVEKPKEAAALLQWVRSDGLELMRPGLESFLESKAAVRVASPKKAGSILPPASPKRAAPASPQRAALPPAALRQVSPVASPKKAPVLASQVDAKTYVCIANLLDGWSLGPVRYEEVTFLDDRPYTEYELVKDGITGTRALRVLERRDANYANKEWTSGRIAQAAGDIGVGLKVYGYTYCPIAGAEQYSVQGHEYIVSERADGPRLYDDFPYKAQGIQDALTLVYNVMSERRISLQRVTGKDFAYHQGRLYIVAFDDARWSTSFPTWTREQFAAFMAQGAASIIDSLVDSKQFRELSPQGRSELWLTIASSAKKWLEQVFPDVPRLALRMGVHYNKDTMDLTYAPLAAYLKNESDIWFGRIK